MFEIVTRISFFFKRAHRHRRVLGGLLFGLALVVASSLLARAGGGGGSFGGGGDSFGGGGSSGGGDGLGVLIYLAFNILFDPNIPWFVKLILLAVLGGLGWFGVNAKMAQTTRHRVRGHVNAYSPPDAKKLAGVETQGLVAKAEKAFMAIQDAWQRQNLSEVRRFISDGVYQRFNTQFKMMALLKQKNVLSDLRIERVDIDKVESDGPYDIAHLRISAWARDQFTCEIDSSMNQTFAEGFVEYWSFLRLRGAPQKDMYATTKCPSCEAPLQKDMGEVGKCAYCNTLINTGEFDWVLSEITQVDDYAAQNAVEHMPSFVSNMRKIRKQLPDFCVQLAEDKASNGYLQMLTAMVFKKPELMRRFVSDEALNKVVKNAPSAKVVYNRLYLNKVTTVGASIVEDHVNLYMVVGVSSQRVERVSDTRLRRLDETVYTKNRVIVLSGSLKGMGKKGSLFAHHCPACGGSLDDSLDVKCPYCGSVLNSGEHDWVISQIYNMRDYMKLKSTLAPAEKKVAPKAVAIGDLYDIKDYALNNMMVVMGADGVFSFKEKEMALKIAKKYGFKEEAIQELFVQAMARRLTLRMPNDAASRRQVLALMKKAADADGHVAASEVAVIEQARTMLA